MEKISKKKDKNLKLTTLGFTLIELLATIVILGLLALIVTPGVAKVIRNSKINTSKASLEGYVREIENASTLYLTDTGVYLDSIEDLELDGKNLDKIENPDVILNNGEVEEVIAEIDGLYCKYIKGEGTSCSEESFYSYVKNSTNLIEILNEIENKYGISEACLSYPDKCTEEQLQSLETNESAITELMSKMDMTYYGIERGQIKSIEFTNVKPSGEGLDISLDNTNDVLLYSTLKDEMYEIKIYSEKEIMFPSDSSMMFMVIENLDKLTLNNINTREVTNMLGMFSHTGELSEVFTLDLGDKFDTRNVTDMSGMFDSTGSTNEVFTLDLGDKFDTRNVTDMSKMFHFTGSTSEVFTLDLGDKFDTRNVTNMLGMFLNTGELSKVFTLDLGDKFDTGNVTNMSDMFAQTGNTSEVFTLDLGDKFDTRNVTDMSGMFYNTCSISEVFTLDLGDKFDTRNVTNMSFMFQYTGYSSSVFTLDLGDKFDTSKVTNMSDMFYNTGYSSSVFTLDLGDKFDTRNVTNMSDMFVDTGASNPNFTLDLSTFDTSKVTDMSYMFSGADTLKTIYVSNKWTTNTVTKSTGMFSGCTSLPNFNSSVVDKTNAHYGSGGYLTLKS